MKSKANVIGGRFGLPTEFYSTNSSPDFLKGKPLLLFNARSGIKLVVDKIKPNSVWLPSYLCPTIISAIDKNKTKIKFYQIDATLNISSEGFINEIAPDDLFLFIDYFGFPIEYGGLRKIKNQGCIILRDCSQNLFVDLRNDISDYQLFSPRKFLGVPDGGILHHNNQKAFSSYELVRPDPEILYLQTLAVIQRREFDLYGRNSDWRMLFQKSEALFSPCNMRMSEISQLMLRYAYDYDQIKQQRRDNYFTLLKSLKGFALFKELPNGVTPLGFPIRLRKRNKLQKKLIENKVYPPIHWNINGSVPSKHTQSHILSHEILTIPCDQRYDEQDMDFIIKVVLEK